MSRYRGRSWGYASFSRDYDKRQKQKELEKKKNNVIYKVFQKKIEKNIYKKKKMIML